MSGYTQARGRTEEISTGRVGAYVFAATVMLMVGIFQALSGLSAIIEDQFFVLGREYAFKVDVTTWGWIHLVLGAVVAAAGWALFTAQTWARVVGVVVAVLSAVANFFFMPYYPFWSITIIALDVWVVYSLTRPLETAYLD